MLDTLALKPDWADRVIARHVGVKHPFVAAVRSPEVAERKAKKQAKKGSWVVTVTTQEPGADVPAGTSTATETVASSTPESRAPSDDQSGIGFHPSLWLIVAISPAEAPRAQEASGSARLWTFVADVVALTLACATLDEPPKSR